MSAILEYTNTIRFLRIEQVIERTQLCRSLIYKLQSSGNFPKSVTVGKRSARWYEHEIQAWLAAQAGTRDASKAGAQ